MVKGNKERRQELARRRKEDKASESERRKSGPECATPVEVRARLLSDAKALGSEEGLYGWVVPPASEDGDDSHQKAWCEDYFRTAHCELKRCKNAHEASISALSHVPSLPGVGAGIPVASRGRSVSPAARRARAASEERSSEPAAAAGGSSAAAPPAPSRSSGGGGGGDGYLPAQRGRGSGSNLSCTPSTAFFPALLRQPLRTCEAGAKLVYSKLLRTQVRTETPLRFVEWNGRLCFDLANPHVFASYCESAVAAAAPAAGAGGAAGAAATPAAGTAAAEGGGGSASPVHRVSFAASPTEEEEEEEGDEGEEEGEGEEEEAAEAASEDAEASKPASSASASLRVRFASVLNTPL
jgi:hypothetical protein